MSSVNRITRRKARARFVFAVSCLLFRIFAPSGFADAATFREGLFTIDYPAGDETLAHHTSAVLQAAQREFARRLPAGEQPVNIVICGSLAEFRARARRAQIPVEGVADPQKGWIVVKAPPIRQEALDYDGTVRHELVHVLLARNTDPAFLPRWLDEGIAMTVGKDFRYESMFRVARMYLQGRLIAYPSLNFAFVAPYTDLEFGDAYAQSLSMTRYLIDRMGEEPFWELVYALKKKDFPEALRTRTGLTPLSFYEQWRRSLWKVALISSLVSGFSIFQLMAGLVILAYWRKYRRGQQVLRQWEEEEEDSTLFLGKVEDAEPPYSWEDADEDE